MDVELELPVAAEAASQARRAIDELFASLSSDLTENARLLVSELVTNAVRHGPHAPEDRVRLRVEGSARLVRVDVWDRGRGFAPPVRQQAADVPGGWGLFLVSKLADRWGVEIEPETHVWFEIEGLARSEEIAADVEDRVLLDAVGATLDLRRAVPVDEGIVEQLGGCTGVDGEGIVGRFGEVLDDREGEVPDDVAIVVLRVRG